MADALYDPTKPPEFDSYKEKIAEAIVVWLDTEVDEEVVREEWVDKVADYMWLNEYSLDGEEGYLNLGFAITLYDFQRVSNDQ